MYKNTFLVLIFSLLYLAWYYLKEDLVRGWGVSWWVWAGAFLMGCALDAGWFFVMGGPLYNTIYVDAGLQEGSRMLTVVLVLVNWWVQLVAAGCCVYNWRQEPKKFK
jgi:hypothetical protein